MEILEYTDVLSPVQIEEVKKQISYCQIAFGKFINGYSCVYLRVNQEKLKERGEVGLTASYVINKKGAFWTWTKETAMHMKWLVLIK